MDELIDIFQDNLVIKDKGALCSVSGGNYEKKIHNVVRKCIINGIKFNTQADEELGGSGSGIDIRCNFNDINNIGVEAKKYNTPDWMQCSIKYNSGLKKWEGSKEGKIPPKSREIFNHLMSDVNIFDGNIPPFMVKQITHEEWVQIKKDTRKWDDKYIDIPQNIIRELYREKGCQYIQISDGYGLYHLGEDICNFNVPMFDIDQQIRIRTKIHTRKNKKGFCNLSVTITCQPKNIKNLNKSPYSLDEKDKLPLGLTYDNNLG